MNKSIIVFSLFLLCAFYICTSIAQTCDTTQGSNTFNPGCTNKKKAYCRRTIETPELYECVECRSNCDCDENEYCSVKPSQVGKCVKFSKYGKSCKPLSGGQITDLDYPEDWKCADLYSDNGQLAIDQAGVCIEQKCRHCDYLGGGGMPSCGLSDGIKTDRTCVHPGILTSQHSSNWKSGRYYETPENVGGQYFLFSSLFLLQSKSQFWSSLWNKNVSSKNGILIIKCSSSNMLFISKIINRMYWKKK